MIRKIKTHRVYLNVKEVPPKINEIIGYLSMDFGKNKLLERDDLAQDLYVVYFDMLRKRPELINERPGYFFIKFKWYLLTKWRKRVKDINKEWQYKLQRFRDEGIPDDFQEHVPYDPKLKGDAPKKKKRLTKKRKVYGF